MYLKTLATIAAASTFATAALAADCDTTFSHLKMNEDGFEQVGTIAVQPNGLVCNAEDMAMQSRIGKMRQQQGWFGIEWLDGDVRHRLVNPSATRWTQEVPWFISPDTDDGTSRLKGWGA